jgi:hypothetical protein
MRKYLTALLHRDPDALAVVRATIKEVWAGLH